MSLSQRVQEQFPQWVIGTHHYRGDETVLLQRDGLVEVCAWLRDEPSMAFNFLMDVSCVDYLKFGHTQASAPNLQTPSPLPYFMKPKPVTETWERGVGEEYRFEVVYHFYSLTHRHRLRVKVPVASRDPVVHSLTSLWASADWFEREVWDMFGIAFTGHPNLKRIMMYESFQGHPLRKDYPYWKRQPLIGPIN